MPTIRFRIRTIMILIAVTAVMMGLLRLAPPLFFALMIIIVQVFLYVLAMAGIPRLFAVCDSFIQKRQRRLSRDQSPTPDTRAELKRGTRPI
jgi:hypothetical protein